VSETSKAIARRVFEELWSLADLALAEELYDPDYVAHIAQYPEPIQGLESFKQFVALFNALYPDLRFTVEAQIAEGQKVVTRWTVRAAALGADVAVSGIAIHRLSPEGKIVESWDNWDAIGALQALGPDVFEKIGLSI